MNFTTKIKISSTSEMLIAGGMTLKIFAYDQKELI